MIRSLNPGSHLRNSQPAQPAGQIMPDPADGCNPKDHNEADVKCSERSKKKSLRLGPSKPDGVRIGRARSSKVQPGLSNQIYSPDSLNQISRVIYGLMELG